MAQDASEPSLPPEPPSLKARRKQAKAELKAAKRRYSDRVKEARADVKTARHVHDERVKEAERALKDSQKRHQKAVDEVRRRLSVAEEGRALAVCAGVTLFADRIYTREGTAWLVPGVQAHVDASGNLQVTHRPTATRGALGCAACGPLGCLGSLVVPKKQRYDTRQAFLTIEGPGVASVVALSPRDEGRARAFAAQVTAAAQGGPAARAEREQAVGRVRAELDELQRYRPEIESAANHLAAQRNDTRSIDAAEKTLAEVEADTSEIDAARIAVEELERPGP